MWISTFHSACVRILRRQAEVIGFMKSSFTIYDSADTRALIKRIIKDLDADTLGLTAGDRRRQDLEAEERTVDVEAYARNVNFDDPAEVGFLEIFRVHRGARGAPTRSTSTT